jgi:hypothetical protein
MQRQTGAAPRAAVIPQWEPQSWLGAATLESVLEVNEEVLVLLRSQCRQGAGQGPLLRDVSDLLLNLDAASLRRVAGSAVLLVDAGFGNSGLWSQAIVGAVNDRDWQAPAPFFTVDGTVALMRLVMTQTWHLARSQPAAARLLLGLSPTNLTVIGACPLNLLLQLAQGRSQWLRPRWENRPRVWRDLLRMAAAGDTGSLERMRVRSLQLLAADARQG